MESQSFTLGGASFCHHASLGSTRPPMRARTSRETPQFAPSEGEEPKCDIAPLLSRSSPPSDASATRGSRRGHRGAFRANASLPARDPSPRPSAGATAAADAKRVVVAMRARAELDGRLGTGRA